jgi:hypothetical protein
MNSIYTCLIAVVSIVCVFIVSLVVTLYIKTKVYKDLYCDNRYFCFYKIFDVNAPKDVISSCMDIYDSHIGTHKSYSYKSSIYIPTSFIYKNYLNIINYYSQLTPYMCHLLNMDVKTTPLSNNLSCGLLIYKKQGDFIDWHYDMNTYNGRFFTVLIPIYNTSKCCNFECKYNGKVKKITLETGQGIIFEGDKLYHRCTKLCSGEVRVILSLTFSTDPTTTFFKRMLNKMKALSF